MNTIRLVLILVLSSLTQTQAAPRTEPRVQKERPQQRRTAIPPTFADVSYGPDESNKLDFWKAPTGAPNPLLVMIHGGGFRAGSKSGVDGNLLKACLDAGISFASLEYRFTQKAIYPAQMLDCARALQFIRSKSGEWGLDPKRIAATGGSAGSGISLWLGFHDDLADPKSSDPVSRQSTRLTCILPTQMQCTYDPRAIKVIVPGDAYNHPALKQLFGVPDTFNWDTESITPEVEARLKDSASITHLTKDDPPVFAVNSAAADRDGNIHHGNFGRHLKKLMDAHKIECTFHLDTDFDSPQALLDAKMAFLKKHFGLAKP